MQADEAGIGAAHAHEIGAGGGAAAAGLGFPNDLEEIVLHAGVQQAETRFGQGFLEEGVEPAIDVDAAHFGLAAVDKLAIVLVVELHDAVGIPGIEGRDVAHGQLCGGL